MHDMRMLSFWSHLRARYLVIGVWFGSEEEKESLPDTGTPNQIQKKKIWEQVQPHLATDASGVAAPDTHFMRTSAGCRSIIKNIEK